MRYDLPLPSELTSAIINSPDLLALLSILLLAIVGLAVSLVLLEKAHSLRKTHAEGGNAASFGSPKDWRPELARRTGVVSMQRRN